MNMIKETPGLKFIFWMLFGVGCLLSLVYIGSTILAWMVINAEVNPASPILLLPGIIALLAQGFASIKAIKFYNKDDAPPNRLFTIVFGSTVTIALLWMVGFFLALPTPEA